MNNLALSIDKTLTSNKTLQSSVDLIGRIGLAAIFLLAGLNKIHYFEASTQYMASGGLPGVLLPAVIGFEFIGALLLIVGYQTRWVAVAFAGFTALSALLFHSDLGDQTQLAMYFKNMAIAGGFLILAIHGAGKFSIDAKRK